MLNAEEAAWRRILEMSVLMMCLWLWESVVKHLNSVLFTHRFTSFMADLFLQNELNGV